MRKILIILLVLPILGLMSCVKQKNCDCGMTGKFVYLEEPEDRGKKQVIAYFISDGFPYFWITGTVPKNYQKTDTLDVNVCLKEIVETYGNHDRTDIYYKIKCIEKED